MKAMNVMNAITARRKAVEVLSDSRLTGLLSSIKSLRGPHQVESGSFRSRRRRRRRRRQRRRRRRRRRCRRRRDQTRFVARRRNFGWSETLEGIFNLVSRQRMSDLSSAERSHSHLSVSLSHTFSHFLLK